MSRGSPDKLLMALFIPYSWVREYPNPRKEKSSNIQERLSLNDVLWKGVIQKSSPQPPLGYSIHSVSLAVSRLSGNTFPAVATQQCGLGRDPSEATLVHTLSGCSGTAWERPNPLCDVTGVKFQCEEGGGCMVLPFSNLDQWELVFFSAPAWGKKGTGTRDVMYACSLETPLCLIYGPPSWKRMWPNISPGKKDTHIQHTLFCL